jgi:hypothetical protein
MQIELPPRQPDNGYRRPKKSAQHWVPENTDRGHGPTAPASTRAPKLASLLCSVSEGAAMAEKLRLSSIEGGGNWWITLHPGAAKYYRELGTLK